MNNDEKNELSAKLLSARDADETRALLAAGADPNARDENGRTPLHEAKSVEQTQALLAAGANPNARGEYEQTPLHVAKSVEQTQALLAAGAVKADPQPQAGPTRDDDSGYDY